MHHEQIPILEAILQELKSIGEELKGIKEKIGMSPAGIAPKNKIAPETSDKHQNHLAVSETELPYLFCDWFLSRGVKIRNYKRREAADAVFDKLALFLGSRYNSLSRLYGVIKRSLSSSGNFGVNLSSASKEEIADSTQFCTMLREYAFLSSYRYCKSSKTILAAPQRDGKIINFFSGGWFERYVYQKIRFILSQNGLRFECLLNPQITLPNGNDFELDLFFLIAGSPLWIECKTSNYQSYITKYSGMRKVFGIPKERAILIILDIPDNLTNSLTEIHDITVANESNFPAKICDTFGAEHPQGCVSTQTEYSPTPFVVSGSLSTLLRKSHLRPLPEYRRCLIEELIAVVAERRVPITMFEIKTTLAETMSISKSQTQDLLNAVIWGGCLLDNDGEIVRSFTVPFSRLISDDPSVIEERCIEVYAQTVLRADPAYFESTYNVNEFERIVGSKAPSEEAIVRLRKEFAGY